MADASVAMETPIGWLYITGDDDFVDSVAFTAPAASCSQIHIAPCAPAEPCAHAEQAERTALLAYAASCADAAAGGGADGGCLSAAVAETVRQLREYFAGERRSFDLPLRRTGLSAFACDVLEAASRIPYARSASYGEIAAAIGRPNAARAVGRALAHNPHAVVVPCHRVRGAAGDLVGYAGGVGAKRFLCELEAEVEDEARLCPGAAELRYLRSRDATFALSTAGMEPIPPVVTAPPRERCDGGQPEQLTLSDCGAGDEAAPPDLRDVAAATAAALRRAGITGRRAAIVVGAARALCAAGAFSDVRRLGDDEAAAALERYDGVGPWTARMLLVFALGRTDVMPYTDPALRRAARRMIDAEKGVVAFAGCERKPLTPSELARRSRIWSPCRAAASLYLWALDATCAFQIRMD